MTCCLWCERVLLILLSVELMATVKPWIWRNVQKLSLPLSIPGSDSRRVESLVWGDAAFELEMVSLSPRYLKWFPLNTPTMEELRRQRRSRPAGAAIKPWLCTEISKGEENCTNFAFQPQRLFTGNSCLFKRRRSKKLFSHSEKPATASSKSLSTEEENITFHSQALYHHLYRFTNVEI